MPTITHTGQSFQIDGRRTWITAASLQYARIDPADRAARLADVRQAGFDTVETAIPWMLHEPRPDRFTFEGAADIEQFIDDAAGQGLRVILRVGPYIGNDFDGGGLPPWLVEVPDLEVRSPNPAYLERIANWFPKLFERIAPLQVTEGGPVLLVQVEHRWHCGNDAAATKYLGELVRMIRESGIEVPLINANDLWTDDDYGTIPTWQGGDDLLAWLRQFAGVRPGVPRIVSSFPVAAPSVAERPKQPAPDPDQTLTGLATILAAGAQPIVAPFHGGTHFDRLGGRIPGPDGGTPTPAAAVGAPIGESGERGPLYHRLRRLAWFSSSFGHVFGDLQPDVHSTVQVPPIPTAAGRGQPHICVVPLRGAGGRIVFVFADRPGASTTLLLDSGERLPIDLGDQCVGWFALDADLGGRARLDYSSVSPVMLVDRRILVLAGAPGTKAIVSISGTPLEFIVPKGREPEVQIAHEIPVVVVNQDALDETFPTEDAVYVGVSGLGDGDAPCRAASGGTAYRIDLEGEKTRITAAKLGPAKRVTASGKRGAKKSSAVAGDASGLPAGLGDWEVAPSTPRIEGTSPRFARIAGPRTLAACGALSGVGWYRATWKSGATKKRKVLPVGAGNRVRIWLGGKEIAIFGVGPDAIRKPFDLPVTRGEQVMTAVARSMGRPSAGNDLDRPTGLFGHLVEVKAITAKPKAVQAPIVEPFDARAFIEGAYLEGTVPSQFSWSFSHSKKSPVYIHIADAPTAGVLLCNGQPVGFHAGASGLGWTTIALDPAAEWFKRGKNELRFAPLEGAGDGKDVAKALALFETVDVVTEKAAWAFEKWSPPADADHAPVTPAEAKALAGTPTWWRCRFDAPDAVVDGAPLRIDLAGLGEGAVFLNGRDLGRFATGLVDGGGSRTTRMLLPTSAIRPTGNILKVFDATGASPAKARFHVGDPSDLDV